MGDPDHGGERRAYDADVLKEAVKAAKETGPAIELIVRNGDHFRTVRLDYHDGLKLSAPRARRDDRDGLDRRRS